MHSQFPWTRHSHTPTAVFDADGKRIVDQWVAPDGWHPTLEEIASIIVGPICDSTKSEHHIMKHGRYAFCTQCGETLTKSIVSKLDALNIATAILALINARRAPTPLDPETAADNAALIAAIPGMVDVLEKVLSAEAKFIAALPAGWEGDPIHDACEEVRAVLASIGRVK